MNIIKSCIIAVSMYSKIPMPQFAWDEKSMRYALAFFPLVGVVIGALQVALFFIWRKSGLAVPIYAALATALPVVVTGGIHMDGFCDTIDALSSHQSKERRLAILKDSNAGAFAVIWGGLYFLLCYGAWGSVAQDMVHSGRPVWMISAGYVTSRALSGLAAVFFQNANKKGSLAAFSGSAGKGFVCTGLVLSFAAAGVLQLALLMQTGVLVLTGTLCFFFYYYHISKKNFGGITGDLAGWFLQCVELLILYIVVITAGFVKNL